MVTQIKTLEAFPGATTGEAPLALYESARVIGPDECEICGQKLHEARFEGRRHLVCDGALREDWIPAAWEVA